MTEYRITENDIPTMLESLGELFHEKGDEVTPTKLAERMSEKLNRPIGFSYASYLSRQFGFITRVGEKHCTRMNRYIVPDYGLLERVKR